MPDSKETIILELRIEDGAAGKNLPQAKKEVEVLATSILGLQQANKKLREERNRLDTSTEEGINKIKELNELIDKNTDTIRENSSALEKQRLGIGDYKKGVIDAFKELNIAGVNVGEIFDKLDKANEDLFKKMIEGWRQSSISAKLFGTTARTALTLTGIGILIAALATIVAYWDDIKKAIVGAEEELKSYFLTQQDGIERSRELLEQYNKELEVQNQLLQLQGEKEQEIYNNRRTALIAQLNNQKQEQKNIQDQINLLLKAVEIEKGRKDLGSITAEEFKEIGLILEKNGGTAVENVEKLKKSYEEVTKTVTNTQNQITLLSAQFAKDESDRQEREIKERLKREEFESDERKRIRLDRLNAQLEAEHDAYIKHLEFLKTFNLEVEADVDGSLKRIFKAREDQRKKELEAEKKAADQQKKIEDFKNHAISDGIELITKEKSQSRVILNSIFKQDAIKETVTNTYNAAMAAYKALAGIPIVGPVLGAAAAALVAVAGAGYVAKIAGVQFAKGGRVQKRGTFEGPSHASGGVDYIRADGKHRINVEGDENFYVLKKSASREINALSALNQKHGGNSWEPIGAYPAMKRYADGGQVSAPVPSRQSSDLSSVITAIQSMKIFVTVEDFNAVANARNEAQTKAQVI